MPLGRRTAAAAFVTALVGTLAGSASPASAAPLQDAWQARTTSVGVTAELEYFGNQSIGNNNAGNPDVRTVVLVIHGDGRDADQYADDTLEAAVTAGKVSSTAVIAPHFLADTDAHAGRLYWSDSGWKEGGESLDAGHLSSFEVVDRLIARVQDGRFPNLDRIVVAGHSAGGQFVQRFAAGSAATGVDEYVTANPSSYLYLSGKRWFGSTLRDLTTTEKGKCSGYNTYKYGTSGRNNYMGRVSADTLRARYAAHPVTYLLGGADTSRTNNLDVTCAADLQGAYRLDRGRKFFAYEPSVYGTTPTGHRKVEVPGIAHSWNDMVKSTEGRQAVFG